MNTFNNEIQHCSVRMERPENVNYNIFPKLIAHKQIKLY